MRFLKAIVQIKELSRVCGVQMMLYTTVIAINVVPAIPVIQNKSCL